MTKISKLRIGKYKWSIFCSMIAPKTELVLDKSAPYEARLGVQTSTKALEHYIGSAAKLEQGSLKFYRDLKGHDE